jgi:formate hydrogenlyase subunit 3/multisubunit Na+/H+ antiporter MnhD subunit
MMNDLFAPFYDNDLFFDWNIYQTLLECVFDNLDYGKLGFLLILTPLILLVLFYKAWEPMRKQRLMYLVVILIILIINYSATTGILNINECILNIRGGNPPVNIDYFIFQMSMISVIYSVISSLIFSFIIKRFSTHNSHNPF